MDAAKRRRYGDGGVKLTFTLLPAGLRDLLGTCTRMKSVSLADSADVLLIAPCTANVIGKIAHGLADDLLACTALATTAPMIIAPAMNENMWANEITQENVAALRSRGVHVVDVGTGDLACGYQGRGRMADVGEIVGVVGRVLDESSS